MARSHDKSLMRNLGEFFGHVWRAVKTDAHKKKVVVNKDVQEEDRGDVTLRRTTIDEIEYKSPKRKS